MERFSLLDSDRYKLSMSNAMMLLYPKAEAEFHFCNRRPIDTFDGEFKERLDDRIRRMAAAQLTSDEDDWLCSAMPQLSAGFREFYRNFQFDPDQVQTSIDLAGQLQIAVRGPWYKSTLWEVPLMSQISDIYFNSGWRGHNMLWDHEGQEETARAKAIMLQNAGCRWMDFGTRRRRCLLSQDTVVRVMSSYSGFMGTSNPLLAMKHGVKCLGTMAHEWIQGHCVLGNIRHANRDALTAWHDIYQGDLDVALTDTYGTDAFLEDFSLRLVKAYDWVRQDSGDPFAFIDKICCFLERLGIELSKKGIVFSDNLKPETCVRLQSCCQQRGIRCCFGIGTNFTNDYPGSLRALNMVIKLLRLNGMPVVKLSDDPSKAIGDSEMVRIIKYLYLGIPLDSRT